MMQHYAVKGCIRKRQAVTAYLQPKKVSYLDNLVGVGSTKGVHRQADHALAQTLRHPRLFTDPKNGVAVKPPHQRVQQRRFLFAHALTKATLPQGALATVAGIRCAHTLYPITPEPDTIAGFTIAMFLRLHQHQVP